MSTALWSQTQDLFRAGDEGCALYRIPALAVTSGTVLAFAEARRDDGGDAGWIDIVVRRSHDGGRTWGEQILVASDPPHTVGNPAPVVDRNTGRVHLLFCHNLGDGDETLICAGMAPRTVWYTYSDDAGATWAPSREITDQVKRPEWTWYATGPCHGVQLASGRLVVPCDHVVGVHLERWRDPHRSHVVYSDDDGASWHVGAIVDDDSNECAVAETPAGELYINCRPPARNGEHVPGVRVVGWSRDGGEKFTEIRRDERLVDPVCQGSLTSVQVADQSLLVFSNVAAETRRRLTLRMSEDGGRTWPRDMVLQPGPAAYSDLCALPGGRVGVLYECGEDWPYERLRWTVVALST